MSQPNSNGPLKFQPKSTQLHAIKEPREGSESFGNLRTEDVRSDDEEHKGEVDKVGIGGDEVARGATPTVDDEANLDRGEVAPSKAEVAVGGAIVARVDKGKGVDIHGVEETATIPRLTLREKGVIDLEVENLSSPSADLLEATIRRYHVRPLIETPKSWGEGPTPMVEDPESGIVEVHGFPVHVEFAPFVRRIFAKHEGVARGCVMEHSAVRGTLIEVLAQMVRLVTTNSPASLLESDIEFINTGVKDLERLGFDLSWFKPCMSKVAPFVEYAGACAELDALKRGLKDAEAGVSRLRQEVLRHESIVKTKGEKASKYLAEMDSIIATDML